MTASEQETKEIDSCLICPMAFRDNYGPMASGYVICTHWGSPQGNTIPGRKPPEWCPIEKRPLLLKVVR